MITRSQEGMAPRFALAVVLVLEFMRQVVHGLVVNLQQDFAMTHGPMGLFLLGRGLYELLPVGNVWRQRLLALSVQADVSWNALFSGAGNKVMLLGVSCLMETQHGYGHAGKGWLIELDRARLQEACGIRR